MMDSVLLESFVAVAEERTVTAAAQRVHISQSALSRRLQQLELELGAQLMVRGRHGVELTDLGGQVLVHARALVGGYRELRRDVEAHLGLHQGTIRLGGGATVTSYLFPSAIARFQAEHPGVRFYVKEAGSLEVATDVAGGGVELGVVTLPVPTDRLVVSDLMVDDIVLVAAAGHPALARPLRPSDLRAHTLIAFEPGSAIRQIIDSRLRRAGVEPEVVMELRSIPSILQMVASTRSLAFVSRLSVEADPNVRAVPVRGLSISRRLGVVTRKGFPLSPAARQFADLLADLPH